MNRIELAKSIVKVVYPVSCKYTDIRSSCPRWGEEFYEGYRVNAGKFRSVIVPADLDFVIKVGACKGGAIQCRRELTVYMEAEKRGLSKYFAEIYGTFRYHNHEFVVMERLKVNSDESVDFYELCMEGNEELTNFMDNFDINDIHSGNFGFDLEDDKPKILDYGSYYRQDNDAETDANWKWQ